MHFMQLPIKENVQFKTLDTKQQHVNGLSHSTNTTHIKPGTITSKEVNAIADTSNPLISQVFFFI